MNILITDSTDSVGWALALEYAKEGNNLFLISSDADSLIKVADSCKLRGARVAQKVCDVNNYIALDAWMEHCDCEEPLDLVFINSDVFHACDGGGKGMNFAIDSWERVKVTIDSNLNRVIYLLLGASKLMRKRGTGKIVVLNSFASRVNIPGFASYSAAKAAVRFYINSVRKDLMGIGVKVSTVSLGCIRDASSGKKLFSLPGFVKPDKVAREIRKGVQFQKNDFYVGLGSIVFSFLSVFLPSSLLSLIIRRFAG